MAETEGAAGQPPPPVEDVTLRPELPQRTVRFTMGADISSLGRQLKRAQTGKFTFFCDEPPIIGGEDAYPPPLSYLAAALGF